MSDLARMVSPWLRAVARGQGLSWPSAEDVAQSTLLALLRHVDRIRDPEAGLAWLAVTARHEAIKVLRVERAVELVPDAGAELAHPTTPGPEAIALDHLRQDLLWTCIGNLPARGQQILHEIAQGGRPGYAALADRVGMPIGSIGPTRKRSLAKARRLLESDHDWLTCA